MTWGTERRKRIADFAGDIGKIVFASAVIGPIVSRESLPFTVVWGGAVVGVAFLGMVLLVAKED